ncbi:MAG: hypothetical protein QOE93_326 [Actinomycetota bacterium]|jgi:hypothetical protein|nr:hypothetical protein [Actinomycetota bacterium]
MAELAGRSYVSKLYRVNSRRRPVIDLLRRAVEESGGRVVSCSYPDVLVAPMFLGAEDDGGHRYGIVLYPFTTTRRATTRRPQAEHRFQVRFGDPVRHRQEPNPLCHDPAGVDVTLVLAVDPERDLIVGLDPLVYSELPIGISGYYRDEHEAAVVAGGWAAWSKEKERPRGQGDRDWEGLESMVGLRPGRFLDYVRFEALATSLGLDTALRLSLAEQFAVGHVSRHALERLFGVDAATILDIVESNFRLGVAVRGSVAEYHLGRLLADDAAVAAFEPIDQDGMPDFRVTLHDGRQVTIDCKNALRETYKSGEAKVETQKTRDSGAGRKYTFDSFDILAACMFSVSGHWTFRFKRSRALVPWTKDPARIGAIQRIDTTWASSLAEAVRES